MEDLTITIPLHLLNNPWILGPLVLGGTEAIHNAKLCGAYLVRGIRKLPNGSPWMDKNAQTFADFCDGLKAENAADALADAAEAKAAADKAATDAAAAHASAQEAAASAKVAGAASDAAHVAAGLTPPTGETPK